MQSLRPSHVLVLAVAFALSSAIARADLVTPDSVRIARIPLGIVTSGGTFEVLPVVTNAYQGLGLGFPTQPDGSGAALSSLNGVSVWSPVGPAPVTPPIDVFQYWRHLSGAFVVPGTSTPATVSSLSLEVMGGGMFWVSARDAHGDAVAGSTLPVGTGSHGGELYTFNEPGIAGFDITRFGLPAISGPRDYAPWGVAEVSFSPVAAPEPGSFLLAALGALGLTAHSWRRRSNVPGAWATTN